MGHRVDESIVGKRFGRLVVIEHFGGHTWRCKCDCGLRVQVKRQTLMKGIEPACKACTKEWLRKRKRESMTKELVHGKST